MTALNWVQAGNLRGPQASPIAETVDIDGDYTPELADGGKILHQTSALTSTITLPAEVTVGFEVGTFLGIAQMGTGTVNIAAGAGATVLGGPYVMAGQYATAHARYLGDNEWLISGGVLDPQPVGGDLTNTLDDAVVQGFHGVLVDPTDLLHGRAYVYDAPATQFLPVSMPVPFLNDPGDAYDTNAAERTLLANAAPAIPANTLVAGTTFEIEAWGSFIHQEGSARTIRIELDMDGVQIVGRTTANIATATIGSWATRIRGRFASVGASGVVHAYQHLSIGASLGGAVDLQTWTVSTATAGVVRDTTQALTVDLLSTLSVASASMSIECQGVVGTLQGPPA